MENSSLRGRYSLSSSNLTSPIAESTCLNGTSSQAKFNWGEGTIGTQNRNNSHIINKNVSVTKNLNVTPHKVAMSPTTRIDPRTYVDIHSNGLTSRIVKYHDNSNRLNRSLSMGNLYNKPGQFPVVHLKKNEVAYKAKKVKNLSMTRIAAPEKSVFHGNTLSSILRSGSIVGMHKSDEEISRENRPILHPPPTENEMAPTRSVLEVLKEISRKRINSDELDGIELVKKHCKEPEPFETVAYNGQKSQCKRQRELSSSTATNLQLSPEQQMQKKRICNYNNDITSSLSSSMCSANKKKLLEIHSPKISTLTINQNNNLGNTSKSTEPLRSENQSCVGKFDAELLLHSNKYTPVTSLQSTPQQIGGYLDELGNARSSIVSRRASEPAISKIKPKLTLFNKDYDEVPIKINNDKSELKDDGDLCGIQFVKPKKSSAMSSTGSLLLEKAKKSKLALMLRGLKGELDEEDEVDTMLANPSTKKIDLPVPMISTTSLSTPLTPPTLSFQKTSTTSPTTPATTTLNTISKTATADTTPSTAKIGLQVSAPPSITTVNSSTSNGFQINVSTPSAITPAEASSPVTTAAVPTSVTISYVSSIPTLSGFNLNKPLTMPTTAASAPTQHTMTQIKTTSTSSTTLANSASIAGIKSFSFGLSTPQTSLSPAPTLSFDPPKTAAMTLPSTQMQPVAKLGAPSFTVTTIANSQSFGQMTSSSQPTFSFGSLATSSTANPTTVPSPVTTTSAPTFNFGGMKNAWGPAISQPSSNTNLVISKSSFVTMSTSAPTVQSVTPAVTSTSSAGGFQFSDSSSTEPPKPLFGNLITATNPQNSNTTFSFPANNAPTTQANQTNSFAFGAPAAAPPVATNPVQTPMFGSTTPVKSTNSFTFGAPTPATPVKPSFSFPSADKPAVAPASTGNPTGGFTFAPPTANSLPAPDLNKNVFGKGALPAAADPGKLVFSFGASTNDQTANKSTVFGASTNDQTGNKPSVFGASSIKPTNLFGAPATTTAQNTQFAFGSSSSSIPNQGITSIVQSTNLFGGGNTSNQPPNTNSIFGAPSAAVLPLQQTSSFTFGTTPTTTASTKPAGGFVFGSSSSIGSNASKPATDLNKTFVFGEGSTTITPVTTGTNLFGGTSTANSASSGVADNKLFSFGAAGSGSSDTNNTFGGSRQTANQSPVFSFGAVPPANQASAQNGNLFAQPLAGAPTNRPIRKAMRRLHKT